MYNYYNFAYLSLLTNLLIKIFNQIFIENKMKNFHQFFLYKIMRNNNSNILYINFQ